MASTATRFAYVATAQKPTGVTHAVVGSFTGPNDVNLVLAKTNRLEVHTVTGDGLSPVVSEGVFGRIATLALIRVQVGRRLRARWRVSAWLFVRARGRRVTVAVS